MPAPERQPEQKEGRRALVGGLTILALILLAVLIISLDELGAGREDSVRVYAAMVDAPGISTGSPVWVAGNEVGTVETVRLLTRPGGENRVLATLLVPREVLPQLRRNSTAHSTRSSLLGRSIIEVRLAGAPTAPPIEPGDTLYSSDGARVELDMKRVAAIGDSAALLMEDLGRLDSALAGRAPRLRQVSSSLATASRELDVLSASFRRGPLGRTLSSGEINRRLASIQGHLDVATAGLGRYTGGEMGARLDVVRGRAGALSESLDTLRALASTPYGFVGRFRADSALSVATAGAKAQMDSLVAEATSNPFMFFF